MRLARQRATGAGELSVRSVWQKVHASRTASYGAESNSAALVASYHASLNPQRIPIIESRKSLPLSPVVFIISITSIFKHPIVSHAIVPNVLFEAPRSDAPLLSRRRVPAGGTNSAGWHRSVACPSWGHKLLDGIGQWRVPADVTLAVAVEILCAGRVDLAGMGVNDSL